MKYIKIYFLLFSVISFAQTCKKFPQEIEAVSYQNWVGGQELSGGGTSIYLDFKKPLLVDIKLVTIYFRNRKFEIDTLSDKNFVARYSYRPELIIDQYGNREIVRKADEKASSKYILKENEAMIEFIYKKKMRIYKLKNIKEREMLAYP